MLTRQRRISNIWSTIETSHTLPADPVVHCIHFALQLQFPQVETNWLLCQGKLTLLTAIYSVQCAHCSTTWCTLHSPLYNARYIALQHKMHCRVQTDCCIVQCALLFGQCCAARTRVAAPTRLPLDHRSSTHPCGLPRTTLFNTPIPHGWTYT